VVAKSPIQDRDAAQRSGEGEGDVREVFDLGAQHHRIIAARQDLAQHRLVDRGCRADPDFVVFDAALGKIERALGCRHPDPGRRRAMKHHVFRLAAPRQ
jgi:hypothetical protein